MMPDSLMHVFSAKLTWQIVQFFFQKQASLNLQPNDFYFFKKNMDLILTLFFVYHLKVKWEPSIL